MNLLSRPCAAWAIAWNSNEFFRARIKLTGLYIIILAVVLAIVSVLLLFGVSRRLNEAATEANIRVFLEQAKIISMELKPALTVESAYLEKEYGRLHYSIMFANGEEVKVDPFTGKSFLEDENFESFQDMFYADLEEMLLLIDVILLVVAAVLSYFLAGRTLKPIAAKMQQQKEFSANAAHELRNPLAAIRSSAESVLRVQTFDAKECHTVLQDIVHESDHLIGISEQLLTLSKYDETIIRRETVQLHTLIPEVVRTIDPLAKRKSISIRQELAPFALEGDEAGLKQLVFNLLHNAIKFSKVKSEVRITLSSGGILTFEDSGKGIAEENIPKLFDRFYMEDASRGEEGTGSGLGLSIVQAVAKAHGANVKVESREGHGSTFTVSFR